MPIGKDSIKKRVAKVPETEAAVTAAPATEDAPKAAKTPAKATKKATASKSTAPKKVAPKAEKAAEPATAVMGNVAPETVEKVIGHAEGKPGDHIQIGAKMPTYLL